MSSSGPKHIDIRQIYARYIDIESQNDHTTARELLSMFLNSTQTEVLARNVIFSDLTKLMSCLNVPVDSHQFSCFYEFVFFVCCENGQKNITVNKAVTAWRLVLAGRFRLLNQWCSFVEEHQRHNISADTWQQVLAFSRCVNEDLDGYDPKGAWPVLIDDFVEHMYRTNQYNGCGTGSYCSCSEGQTEPGISSTFSGLNLLPGSKRKKSDGKCCEETTKGSLINKYDNEETAEGPLINKFILEDKTEGSMINSSNKRLKHKLVPSRRGCWDSNAVEDGLGKGFEGHLIGCCPRFQRKGSYT